MAQSRKLTAERREWLRCWHNPAYFIGRYGYVYDATSRTWLRFALWPAQAAVLDAMHRQRLTVVLKARQLGLSWLVLGYGLWLMLFKPAATVLLFSKRDDEAVHLLSFRLRGMYDRLPGWQQCTAIPKDASHEWRLSNGSAALAFPTTGGRSYTATLAIVDEADFAPDLDGLLNAVKPTIDAGGRLILVSTVDKSRPDSAFKRVYRAAQNGQTAPGGWARVFLGWQARPDRTPEWYTKQRDDVLARTGSLDDLYQEYPETEIQALAPRIADVRFAPDWLEQCSDPRPPLSGCGPSWPGLEIYEAPVTGGHYVIGADPAEGNPQSDDSAATVLDTVIGAEVAGLAGRFDPAVFAAYLAGLSRFYNNAPVMVERNNHGHAVLLWLAEYDEDAWPDAGAGVWCGARDGRSPPARVTLISGLDGKPGWLTTARSKALAFDHTAECFRSAAARVRSPATLRQLQSIRGATLAAPEGQHDDRAMSFVLALAGAKWHVPEGSGLSAIIPPVDPIWEADHGPIF